MFTTSCNAYLYDVPIFSLQFNRLKSFKMYLSQRSKVTCLKLHVSFFVFVVFSCPKTAVFDTYLSQLWKTYAKCEISTRVWKIENNLVSYISIGL